MFTLKIIIYSVSVVIAIVALFGSATENGRLNNFGVSLLLLILVAGIANGYVMYHEDQQAKKSKIETIKAKRMIYGRILNDVEAIKYAFLWEKYDLLAKQTPLFDYENSRKIFLNQNEETTSQISSLVQFPLKQHTKSLLSFYEIYKPYLSFNDIDKITHYIKSSESLNLPDLISTYNAKNGKLITHLNDNGVTSHKINYLFLSLHAMEKTLIDSKVKIESEFDKLLPECNEIKNTDALELCY
ncbi:hypothetical protein [Psychromonas sp. L1A2]|uniref:hypothetical protein n=1 Tax=Psychromonas sp. L1A2 TaxID=2686356 RepID=UPI001357483E|nr:hypothetical protein [Psychromonas sp. L1A2]